MELENERLSWTTNNALGAFSSPLKFTQSGNRAHATGAVGNAGSMGLYWSSSTNQLNSNYLGITASNGFISDARRGIGDAIRCIKN